MDVAALPELVTLSIPKPGPNQAIEAGEEACRALERGAILAAHA